MDPRLDDEAAVLAHFHSRASEMVGWRDFNGDGDGDGDGKSSSLSWFNGPFLSTEKVPRPLEQKSFSEPIPLKGDYGGEDDGEWGWGWGWGWG